MPQNINLNVFPYYDDFNEDKNYYRVLFKPGTSIQSRELTTLQTILQNQIEKFGKHFFKDGAMIIPGNIYYDSDYSCVEIDNTHLGIPVEEYLQNLIGKKIKGQTSNVVAKIENVINESQSERKNNTLYIKYISSSQTNFVENTFIDGENLILLDEVSYPSGILNVNNTFATTIINNSTSVGSAVKISSGVYFIRGFFLTIDDHTLILDQYENTPSYRVGLLIKESFASASNEFSDLLDNSQGYSNFASPGADRLLIQTELTKKPLDNFDDENFVQLLKIENGIVETKEPKQIENPLIDELARRTYDESGNYYVKPFNLEFKESLNDNLGNNGIYDSTSITKNGNIPSDDIACISISPGKAYIKGYEIEKTNNTILDIEKPRTTEAIKDEFIQFNFGTKVALNNVYGYSPIGITTDSIVNFYDSRTVTGGSPSGSQIGVARLYDLKLKDSSYTDASSEFEASLFDIQTYTKLTISSGFSTSYIKSTYIEGANSGANGYLVSGISTTTTEFNLYQVSGSFVKNEPLNVDGNESNRVVKDVIDYKLNDVCQLVSNSSSFTADVVLSRKKDYSNKNANYKITAASPSPSGISTIITANDSFYLNVKKGDILEYNISGLSTVTYNKVESVNKNTSIVTISSVPKVINVNEGALPTSDITVNSVKKVSLDILNKNKKLYSELNNKNINLTDISNSTVTFRKIVEIPNISSANSFEVSIFESSPESILVPFDEESYTLIYDNGTIEPLDEKKLRPNRGSNNSVVPGRITLRNLSNTGKAYLTITYQKINCKTRRKVLNKNIVRPIIYTNSIDKTKGTGLSLNDRYGTRIEDKVICLYVPEVTSIIGIFESSDNTAADLPYMEIDSDNDSDIIIGERILSTTNKAIGTYVGKQENKIEFCYLNDGQFNEGDSIYFEESGVTGVITEISLGDKNITDYYTLDSGSRESYLDFSRIIRKPGVEPPSRRIKIVYNYYSLDQSNDGSFVTVNSYDQSEYKELPFVKNDRYSDILDFRPRVENYSVDEYDYSPYDFESRVFTFENSSSEAVVAQDSTIILSYDYYLPRIDKLFLTKNSNFKILKGVPSSTPKSPEDLNNALRLATIYYPAYVFDVNDIEIKLDTYKRYRMKDISRIEERLTNVEYYTSLSLLEMDTKNIQIVDSNTNLNRFKSGFFVDNFSTENGGDTENPIFRAEIDTASKTLIPEKSKRYIDLKVDENLNSNVIIKGKTVCLNYNEVEYLKNSFATKSEKINPFNVVNWVGKINLIPSTVYIQSERKNRKKLYIKEKNIGIFAKKLKPNTRIYSFFDEVEVSELIAPKLIEIEMVSGAFQAGEFVVINDSSKKPLRFKLAPINHKYGPTNNPSKKYIYNPYDTSKELKRDYSATSTVLNIDIEAALESDNDGHRFNLEKGITLKGKTSGAEAKITDIKYVTDEDGDFIGMLSIPDPSIKNNIKFKPGTKTLTLTTSPTNSDIFEFNESVASINLNVVDTENNNDDENIIQDNFEARLTPILKTTKNIIKNQDSLAQSFSVIDDTGIYATKCNLFFESKDGGNSPVALELRTLKNGIPSDLLIPNSQVILYPSDIEVSSDSTIPTTFEFDSPVFLEGNMDYCIVLSSTSDEYKIWISQMGQEDISSKETSNGNRVIVSQQPLIGSLFKAQNITSWNQNLYDDIKFTLYRADFTTNIGTVNFYNPSINSTSNYNQVERILNSSISSFGRRLNVGLNSSLSSTNIGKLSEGYTLYQTSNSGFKAEVDKIAGAISVGSSLTIVNAGYGFTNNETTYTNVDLVSITGNGKNGRITLGVKSGIATVATITNGGSDYSIGDVLTIDYQDTNNRGNDLILSIPSNSGILTNANSLLLKDVQGTLVTGSGDLIVNEETLSNVYPLNFDSISDGRHFRVNLKNHGMYSKNDKVIVSGISPDVPVSFILNDIGNAQTGEIEVSSAINFINFENREVGIGTLGYIMIDDEIISYVGVNTTSNPNKIIISSDGRGIDDSNSASHKKYSKVYKYEFNGISLRKINKEHLLSSVDYDKYSIDLDNYYVRIDSDNGKFFNTDKSGSKFILNENTLNYPRSTFNISYNVFKPVVNIISPEKTNISSKVRTYTGKSVNGSENAFEDNGFEDCYLNVENTFNTMRSIFSRANELEYIDSSNNKSLTLQLSLETSDSRLSPTINLNEVGAILTSNRISSKIEDYTQDYRINSVYDDPSSTIYVSKIINLNKSADSLKVIFDAYRHSSNDIRVAYRIFKDDTPEESQVYQLFPGYKNIDNLGYTIDESQSDGTPDKNIMPSSREDDYKTYEYTVNTPTIFTGFQIKIMISGTNQAKSPKIKDLRVIATR